MKPPRPAPSWSAMRRIATAVAMASGIAALAMANAAGVAAQTSPEHYTPGEESPEDFPEGPGRDETFYACIACHNFKLVAAQGMSRARWDETITFMVERHNMPPVDDADRTLILGYLSKTFPERARRGWQSPFTQ